MSEHLDLVGLLRGELGNTELVAAGDHLATCATCQEELADAVVGHALLVRAGTTLGPTTQAPRPAPLAPPAAPRRRRGMVLTAAAAAVVTVLGAGAVWWRSDDSRPTNPGTGVEAALKPVPGADAGDGVVTMTEDDGRTRMTVTVRDLPRATGGEFYYAWLLDPSTNKMLALGVVHPEVGATFDVDDSLVASYSAIDVSLESDDGDPGHSVTSVLRGDYEPDQLTTTQGRNTE